MRRLPHHDLRALRPLTAEGGLNRQLAATSVSAPVRASTVRYRTEDWSYATARVLVPVLTALAWLLGTMALLAIPFNSETVVITGLAIGLGVDYTIHLTERSIGERQRRPSLTESMNAAVTGTGGAFLGSAATTAAGFGVLTLALSPPLNRFGLVTGPSIIFAFGSCITVLPSLLVIRERYSL